MNESSITPTHYITRIKELGIKKFGWDKHASALGISYKAAKDLWNQATNHEVKQMRRTEFSNTLLPEYSNRWKNYYRLELDAPYHAVNISPTFVIIIPNGLIWDRGSVPYLLKLLVPNDHYIMLNAYLAHDVLCETRDLSNFLIDAALLEVGQILGASWIERNLPYFGVRIGSPFRRGGDIIKRGFNISEYNRELIRNAEAAYLDSGKQEDYQDMHG